MVIYGRFIYARKSTVGNNDKVEGTIRKAAAREKRKMQSNKQVQIQVICSVFSPSIEREKKEKV